MGRKANTETKKLSINRYAIYGFLLLAIISIVFSLFSRPYRKEVEYLLEGNVDISDTKIEDYINSSKNPKSNPLLIQENPQSVFSQ